MATSVLAVVPLSTSGGTANAGGVEHCAGERRIVGVDGTSADPRSHCGNLTCGPHSHDGSGGWPVRRFGELRGEEWRQRQPVRLMG